MKKVKKSPSWLQFKMPLWKSTQRTRQWRGDHTANHLEKKIQYSIFFIWKMWSTLKQIKCTYWRNEVKHKPTYCLRPPVLYKLSIEKKCITFCPIICCFSLGKISTLYSHKNFPKSNCNKQYIKLIIHSIHILSAGTITVY